MINVKDQVYTALKGVCIDTMDSYPPKPEKMPFIFFAEDRKSVV